MKYSIDTSVFIEAWVRHYPPDVFPAVWDQIERGIANEKLQAIVEVYREIEEHGDDLLAWAKKRKKKFVALGGPIQDRARRILADFPDLAKADRTRRDADPFVIALAWEYDLTVVTYEVSKPTKPRIPDVCRALKIPCITLVELFRQEGWKF
jgi:predicted nucleic acid-binding protein